MFVYTVDFYPHCRADVVMSTMEGNSTLQMLQIKRAFHYCRDRNFTIRFCTKWVMDYLNLTDRRRASPRQWTDDGRTVGLATLGVFVTGALCLLGVVAALAGLALHRKQRQKPGSGPFLQLAVFVTDLCFVLVFSGHEWVQNGYDTLVFRHDSVRSLWTFRFFAMIPRSVVSGIEVFSVWLVAVITIDR